MLKEKSNFDKDNVACCPNGYGIQPTCNRSLNFIPDSQNAAPVLNSKDGVLHFNIMYHLKT